MKYIIIDIYSFKNYVFFILENFMYVCTQKNDPIHFSRFFCSYSLYHDLLPIYSICSLFWNNIHFLFIANKHH